MNEQGKMGDRTLKLTQIEQSLTVSRRPLNLRDRRMIELEDDRFAPAPLPMNMLLRHLPSSMLAELYPKMKKVSLDGGEYLYRPDEEVEWIYFPETTAISELQILEDGRTIEVSLTGRESAVGVPFLFLPGLSVNWVQASAPGVAVKIRRDVLFSGIRSEERAARVFDAAVQSYIRQMSQKVACNAHHSVLERFSSWLLMVRDRCSAAQLKLTQEYIARVLGVYRPSVTCIAQEMREAGLIDYVRGNIVIRDHDGLKERACGCYTALSPQPLESFMSAERTRSIVM